MCVIVETRVVIVETRPVARLYHIQIANAICFACLYHTQIENAMYIYI